MKKIYQVNINPKKVVVARLIANKIGFKKKGIFRDRYYIMVKWNFCLQNIIILSLYVLNSHKMCKTKFTVLQEKLTKPPYIHTSLKLVDEDTQINQDGNGDHCTWAGGIFLRRNVLKLLSWYLHDFINLLKIITLYNFKWMDFMVYILYLKKAIKNKSIRISKILWTSSVPHLPVEKQKFYSSTNGIFRTYDFTWNNKVSLN